MPGTAPSALVTDNGRRVLLRLQGRVYDLTQHELRSVLGLPDGPPGLGITIDRDHLLFEFPLDQQSVKTSAAQLRRRLAKTLPAKVWFFTGGPAWGSGPRAGLSCPQLPVARLRPSGASATAEIGCGSRRRPSRRRSCPRPVGSRPGRLRTS